MSFSQVCGGQRLCRQREGLVSLSADLVMTPRRSVGPWRNLVVSPSWGVRSLRNVYSSVQSIGEMLMIPFN